MATLVATRWNSRIKAFYLKELTVPGTFNSLKGNRQNLPLTFFYHEKTRNHTKPHESKTG
uniref:hypothetical protein n=1 Tax=Gimesia algae TaxID=2527971 RepID=UPI0018D5EF43|nr:hypothetical protein [Gimesia algae]